jgi:hypothetical protein
MSAEGAHLPGLVQTYLARSLASDRVFATTVRVVQVGEMGKRPGARPMRFRATEDFAVDRLAFIWRARFPILGPLTLSVVDEYASGAGELRVSLFGLPLQRQRGPETTLGEAMRYLAELAWAPQAIAQNRELDWREVDERTVEVSCDVGGTRAAVRWQFDAAGDFVRATGTRPYPTGKEFVPRTWGGDFADYSSFAGIRVPAFGEAWWELPEGRFAYWRGRIRAVELLDDAPGA